MHGLDIIAVGRILQPCHNAKAQIVLSAEGNLDNTPERDLPLGIVVKGAVYMIGYIKKIDLAIHIPLTSFSI